jgi:hypothetical protein
MTYGNAFMIAVIYCSTMVYKVSCSLHVFDDVKRSVAIIVGDVHITACKEMKSMGR